MPGFVSSALGPLLEYDERRGTDLVGTLHAYFAAGGSLARTREALHVHVNTVTQRLDRVSKLLGEDWQAPDRSSSCRWRSGCTGSRTGDGSPRVIEPVEMT